ncbi:hypothetical protein [uncultured Erythrobacter sp.]|uniref:hypothetical protein n=1 Tax=uncultured Erythrobacter sp. TaxID=263913 RepID=UPI002619349A|nr:hypothetical protein [uncultured Erythrobacter sp.]
MTNPRAEPFFFNMTIAMIVIIFAGFGASALYLPEFPFPPSTLLIFHGIVMLGWYILTASQARLIGKANFTLHKRLGQLSAALVALILVTGYFAVSAAIARPETSIAGMTPAGSTIFPTMDLLGFVLFYALALANRTNGAAHKRLMVLAGLMMLPPATARLGLAIGFEPLAGIAAFAIAGAFLVYDWRSRGRPHWASVLGLVVAVGGAPVRFMVGPSETWARIAEAIY